MTKYYLKNADLLAEVKRCKKKGKMSNELAKMLQLICENYGRKPSFSGYSYIDDMKSYAMFMLVKTWHYFNPEKSENAFAFYTQCIKHSFIQFLNREKQHRDALDLIMIEHGFSPSYNYEDSDNNNEPIIIQTKDDEDV